MNRRNAKKMDLPPSGGPLILLLGCIALGALAGCFFAAAPGGQQLPEQLQGIGAKGRFSLFFLLLLQSLQYLVPVFLCGFFRAGTLALPLLFALRGFTLSKLISTYLLGYGMRGVAAAFTAYFTNALFITLCMLILGARAFALCASQKNIPRGRHGFLRIRPQGEYYGAALICLVFCGVYALLGCVLSPLLSTAALAILGA